MNFLSGSSTIDEQIVDLIAARVSASLRKELLALLADAAPRLPTAGLTVEQVAMHVGVARSTVYAHWREGAATSSGAARRRRSASPNPPFPAAPPDSPNLTPRYPGGHATDGRGEASSPTLRVWSSQTDEMA